MRRMDKRRAGAALMSGVALAALLAGSGFAEACLNGVRRDTHIATRQLVQAERLLEAGDFQQALDKARGVQPRDAGHEARRSRIMAVAQLRLGRVEEARALLAPLWRVNPQDAYLKARMGELLAANKAPAEQRQGRALLEELAKADIMPDAEGYRALGRLRRDAGDKAGSAQAIERCLKMAGGADLCSLSEPTKPAS